MSSVTPEARVIAAFTVVVALILGAWHSAGSLVASMLGSHGGAGASLIGGVTVIALAVCALLGARSGIAAGPQSWAVHLGQATTVLSVLLMVAAVAGVVSGIVNEGYGYGY